MLKFLFGKYRFLVVSITLFLIFDLGVLILNFYTSGKLAQQAELINLAAQQRTLTQQMSKSTLYIKAQKLQSWVYQSGLDELKEHYTRFSSTLDVLNNGGEMTSFETGMPTTIHAVSSVEGLQILAKTNTLWAKFETVLNPLMVDVLITDEEIQPASAFIANNNLKLYQFTDELTEHFKQATERQTNFLRSAQVIGITLATINFFIILFHFLRQLNGMDRRVQLKQHESDQILATINEGVFLLNDDMRMGGQHSKQLVNIFGIKKFSGRKLSRFLREFFPKKVVNTAMDFIQLYFKDHIEPELINDINPLKQVEVSIVDSDGDSHKKYLNFSFARLDQNTGEPKRVLVTIKDVTAEILLESRDRQAEKVMGQKMTLLTQMLPIPPKELNDFLKESVSSFDRVNALLKKTKVVTDNYENTLVRIAREAHKLKGNAASIGLETLADEHHEFETLIENIKRQSKLKKISGRDLLPLTIQLNTSYNTLEIIAKLREKLVEHGHIHPIKVANSNMKNEIHSKNSKWSSLNEYTKELAQKEQVLVDLNLRGLSKPIPTRLTQALYPMALQLLRNSIAHGIEDSGTRLDLKKPDKGQITLSISHDRNNNYRFLFEDDGGGFDYEMIRKELITKNIINNQDANALGHTALIKYAFNDAISTRKNIDHIAGRGVGLPIVWQQIRSLGGRLKIRSVKTEFTQFIVDFSFSDDELKKNESSVRMAG